MANNVSMVPWFIGAFLIGFGAAMLFERLHGK